MNTELQNLLDNVNTLQAEHDELIKENYAVKRECANICFRNVSLIFGELKEIEETLYRLYKSIGQVAKVKDSLVVDETTQVRLECEFYSPTMYFYDKSSSAGWWYINEFESQTKNKAFGVDDETVKGRTRLYYQMFLKFFGTEDKAYKFLDFYRNVACQKIQLYINNLKDSNAKLVEGLAKIKECMSNTSSITENENGDIEIHINGKTYIGKVKEQ